jgi:hypothetical protein
MSIFKGVIVAGVSIAGVYIFVHLLGPGIDNWLKIGTSRDLKTVQNIRLGEGRLEEVIAARYKATTWCAHHDDRLFLTTVECRVRDAAGRYVLLAWEVGHSYSPHSRLAPKKLFICALSKEAAELTPALVPPGLPWTEYPEQASAASTFLFQWASKNWVNGDPTKLSMR